MYNFRRTVTTFMWSLLARKHIILLTAACIGVIVFTFVYVRPPAVSFARQRVALYRFNNMSDARFIYDFEYLMWALEENWPFFNLSVSANDVDVWELADNMRYILHTTDVGHPHDFLDLLHENFLAPIGQLGHLRAWRQYEDYINTLGMTLSSIRRHESMEPVLRGVHFPIEEILYPDRLAVFSRIFCERNVPEYYMLWFNALTRPETITFYQTLRDAGRCTPPRPPDERRLLRMETIEEGGIAYLGVSRMINVYDDRGFTWNSRNMGWYESRLFHFFYGIVDYDHLIIDLRGNRGGWHWHFDMFIARPASGGRNLLFPLYVFYTGGEYSVRTRTAFADSSRGGLLGRTVPLGRFRSLAETSIEYGIRSSYGTFAHSGTRDEFWQNALFGGKVWLLTDGYTASGAEAATVALKYSRLATVVGEETRGIFGTGHEPLGMHISLPNTGILLRMDIAYYTDTHGRPFQGYGISPHYFNRPGYDALETVLQMIAERAGG